MKAKKKSLLIVMTLLTCIMLMFFASACTFSFGNTLDGKPSTTGYVVMTTEEEPSSASKSFEDIVAELQPKVVEVYAQIGEDVGAGSGVIVGKVNNESGTQTGSIIVTNHHVIADGTRIIVKLFSGEDFEAKLIGSDYQGDIAILEISATGIEPVAWTSDSAKIRVGSTAIAIGNALGSLGGTVTKGIISATAREIDVEGQIMTLLQTDASINGGNSGGGLFSEAGNLIGVVNAKAKALGVEGLGFAIPANTARALVNELFTTATETGDYGYIDGRWKLGITIDAISTGFYGGYYGVSAIDTSGSAYLSGLRLKDQIVSITVGGKIFNTTNAIIELLAATDYNIGDQLVLSVKSNGTGAAQALTITIGQYIYRMPTA